jgi:hypothetical protein
MSTKPPHGAISPSESPSQEFYTWTFPGAPVRIQLSLKAVEEIQCERRLAAVLGGEIGGVLLGRHEGHIVEIEHVHPVFSGHPAVTGEESKEQYTKAIGECCSRRGGLSIVGWYRSAANEIRLTEDDGALIEALFAERHNVFLIISAGKDHDVAGFFFWDNGRLFRDFCFMEFPFDVQHLRMPKPPKFPDAPTADSSPGSDAKADIHSPESTGVFTRAKATLSFATRPILATLAALLLVALVGVLSRGVKQASVTPRPMSVDSKAVVAQRSTDGQRESSASHSVPSVATVDSRPTKSTNHSVRDTDRQQQQLTTGTRSRSSNVDRRATPGTLLKPSAVETSGRAGRRDDILRSHAPTAATATPSKPHRTLSLQELHRVTEPIRTSEEEPPPYSLPTPIHRVKPVIPRQIAETISSELIVLLKLSVDRNGRVIQATPVRQQGANKPFVQLAVEAALMWIFEPAHRKGENVPGEAIVEFRFMPPNY